MYRLYVFEQSISNWAKYIKYENKDEVSLFQASMLEFLPVYQFDLTSKAQIYRIQVLGGL